MTTTSRAVCLNRISILYENATSGVAQSAPSDIASKCAEIADRHSYAAAQAILRAFSPSIHRCHSCPHFCNKQGNCEVDALFAPAVTSTDGGGK